MQRRLVYQKALQDQISTDEKVKASVKKQEREKYGEEFNHHHFSTLSFSQAMDSIYEEKTRMKQERDELLAENERLARLSQLASLETGRD